MKTTNYKAEKNKSLCEKCKFYSEYIETVNELYKDEWERKVKLCSVLPDPIYISGYLSECNFYEDKA